MASDLESSLRYLYALQSHGIKPGLRRTIALLGALGDPHHSFRVFHVAGTNGKGSTAAMLASILTCQGYRVGLYTSPHLLDFTERIQVNGMPLPRDRVGNLTDRVRRAAETSLSDSPTFFEATTAMAFAHFADEAVQCGVIEVGLGGRFDATNVVRPLVSIITTIGLDHQEYLGHTCDDIAQEKAGIIKEGISVVTGRIDQSPLAVIHTTAKIAQAPCFSLTRDFEVSGETPARFTYHGRFRRYEDLECPLLGRHQLDNAGCALAAVEIAEALGVSITETNVREGLRTVRWPGRLEVVGRQPEILLDGAHNPQAAHALANHLMERIHQRPTPEAALIFIIGMMRDKDQRGFLTRLAGISGVSRFILTKAAHPRAAEPATLEQEATGLGIATETVNTVQDALNRARALADVRDTICVTGSLLVVGEAKALVERTTVSDLQG